MKKMRMGLIGAGWMAEMYCDARPSVPSLDFAMVYARNLQKAKNFSEKHNIPRWTSALDEMLLDPEIDAVCIATTNETHFPLAMQALESGKAVLLEKPFTLNAAQARQLIDMARKKGVFLMEAMWSRFIPGMQMLAQLVRHDAIGNLCEVNMQLGRPLNPQDNSRVFDLGKGGGALLDVGVYPLSILEMLSDRVPVRYLNVMHRHSSGVDEADEITLHYSSGLRASVLVTMREELPSTLTIEGTRGSIHCPDYGNVQEFTMLRKDRRRRYDFSSKKYRYAYQLEHFADCVRNGESESFVMPLASTLRVMQMLDGCRAAANYRFPGEDELPRREPGGTSATNGAKPCVHT